MRAPRTRERWTHASEDLRQTSEGSQPMCKWMVSAVCSGRIWLSTSPSCDWIDILFLSFPVPTQCKYQNPHVNCRDMRPGSHFEFSFTCSSLLIRYEFRVWSLIVLFVVRVDVKANLFKVGGGFAVCLFELFLFTCFSLSHMQMKLSAQACRNLNIPSPCSGPAPPPPPPPPNIMAAPSRSGRCISTCLLPRLRLKSLCRQQTAHATWPKVKGRRDSVEMDRRCKINKDKNR